MVKKKQTKARLWQKKHIFYWQRYYKFTSFHKGKKLVVAMCNGMVYHGGISDRLRGIVSTYAWAKSKGYPFRIFFNSPFPLENYLHPNEYEWIPSEKEITFSSWWSRPLFMIGYQPHTLLKSRVRIRQVHTFLNSFSDEIASKVGYSFYELYNELFKPSEDITSYIESKKSEYSEWSCLVFRFQNLLGDSLETGNVIYYKDMSDYSPQIIADKCIAFAKEFANKNKNKVLICSDSNIFLNEVKNINNCFIVDKKVVHMDYCKSGSYELHLKTFLDFYMIANSKEVISVGTKEMYPTNFPKTAAETNNVPFSRILI